MAAHELKTPLALIRQLALLLDDDLTSSADKTQIQQRIIRTSEQALQLTIDLANSANLTPSLFPLEPGQSVGFMSASSDGNKVQCNALRAKS